MSFNLFPISLYHFYSTFLLSGYQSHCNAGCVDQWCFAMETYISHSHGQQQNNHKSGHYTGGFFWSNILVPDATVDNNIPHTLINTHITYYYYYYYYYYHFTAPWIVSRTTRGSRYQKVKTKLTNLDLLEQETVSGSGISWAICKSASFPRQITMPASLHSVFTGRMPFLPPNQQHQSTEG